MTHPICPPNKKCIPQYNAPLRKTYCKICGKFLYAGSPEIRFHTSIYKDPIEIQHTKIKLSRPKGYKP